MTEQINEQKLVAYIAGKVNVDEKKIRLVLKHAKEFLDNAQEDANGEAEVDGDELVDYVMSRSDVKLDELTVETILDLEMDYLMEQGVAGYVE